MTARTFFAVALVSLLATGCGSRGEDSASTPATDAAPVQLPAALDGRTFLSTEVTGLTLVDGTRVSLDFTTSDAETATLGGTAGCNRFGSPFWITDGRLQAEAFSMTEMACEPTALMDQDSAVVAFLSAAPAISLDGDALVLTGDTITMTLLDREVADPDRPLDGTTWTIDTVLTSMAASTVPLGITPTLVFDGAEVQVDTGCNTGSAPATIDGQQITFGPLILTEVACSDEVGAFEAHLVETLSGTRTFSVTADHLQLSDPSTGAGIAAIATS